MKLKINKASDLSSISVLPPPQSRRLSAIPTAPQTSQLRSQSQQSFSQGFSSQPGMFSQFSQSSLSEPLANDQRFNSQERENSVMKTSCFLPSSHSREESQMPLSRSSTNITRKWNPSSVPDHKCQISEVLEHRMGMMETSLDKFGMVVGSVQSDIVQVNKGTKEMSLEMEGIRQKLTGLDASLQLLIKGQEDIKFSLDGSLKSISEKISKDISQDKLQQIFLVLSALPQQMGDSLLKLQSDLRTTLMNELQKVAGNVGPSKQSSPSILMLPGKVTSSYNSAEREQKPFKNPVMPSKANGQSITGSKVEMGTWNTVKTERTTFTQKTSQNVKKRRGVSPINKDKQYSVIIESDEEINGVFSCLIERNGKGVGNYTVDQATKESERILRKARRRKRKHCNPIIID